MRKFFAGIIILAIIIFITPMVWGFFAPKLTQKLSSKKLCENYSGIPDKLNKHPGMVYIAGGNFIMGNNSGYKDKKSGFFESFPEEAGEHKVKLDGFWIDSHEVTNAQFKNFVQATGYKTIAEMKPKKEWLPKNFPEEKLVPGSAVFISPEKIKNKQNITQWWVYTPGANWRHPYGPESNITNKQNHPVVHIAYADAQAYAKWAGKELPTEAQWEYAAKGGLINQIFSWGSEYILNNNYQANTYQGNFPVKNTNLDGYKLTAPVGCYKPNNFGLFDMIGNTWEMVKNNYRPGHIPENIKNPTGPKRSFDPAEPSIAKHVIKGGSYLCAPGYCMRYRPSARQAADFTMGTSHIGFRLVKNI